MRDGYNASGERYHAMDSRDSAHGQVERGQNASNGRCRRVPKQGARSRERNRPFRFGRGAVSLVFLGFEFFDVSLELCD